MSHALPRTGDWTSARMRDGTRIAYRLIAGSGRRRFALVHSLAMDGTFWDRTAARLGDDADILVYDCRGHGRSDKPAGPYTVAQFADDLAEVFTAVGWDRAVVAGASMGGCVSLAFAAAHPAKVAGLGLIDTTAWYGEAAPQQWEERAQKGLQDGLAALIPFQVSRWVTEAFREANRDLVDAAIAIFLANDPVAYVETCRMLGAADLRSALPRFAWPTRILVGEEDYATPVAMAEAMRDAIPGAELRVIAGARHLTPLECPEVIAGALRELADASA
ncbi:MAG TPA: alpha/beta hydrolase [Inquilinus sp.]|nr:alpha/beta hydrolase [Inquilinus sp.]